MLSVIGEMMLVIRVSISVSTTALSPVKKTAHVSQSPDGDKNTVIDNQEAKHELSEAGLGLDVARLIKT